MKNIFYNIIGVFAVACMLFLTSCDDELDLGPTVLIDSVNPEAVFTGEEVTITGENLHTVINVFVGNRHATDVVDQSESSIRFVVPATAEPGDNKVVLAMKNGYRVSRDLEVNLRPIPVIETISPSAAAPGENVTIRGLNLGELTSARIGGIEATIASASNNELELTVPSGLPLNTPAAIELETVETTTTSTSIFYVGPNLVANSDFEAGSGDDFDSWEKLNSGDQMTERTGAEAYAGRSIHIVPAANNPWSTQLATQEMQLNLNSEYTVLFWAKADDAGAFMRVSSSQFNHHGSGSDFFYGDNQDIPTEWTQMTWTFTVTADLPSYKLVMDMGEGSVPFAIDNVTLIETGAAGPPIPDNQVMNPGFENGLENWTLANGMIEASSEDVHCGAQALKVTGAGNPDQAWRTQLQSDGMMLTAGVDYEVKMWAKATADNVPISVSVSRYNGGDGSDYFYSDQQVITQEWAEYSWTFTAQDPPSGINSLVLDLGRSAEVFYIDDISVKEALPAVNILADGSFENGISTSEAPNEDAAWEVFNGMFEITTNADEVADGSQALKVTGAGNPDQAWRTQIGYQHIPELVAGTEYRVSIMARATAPDVPISVSVSQYNGGDGSDYFYGDPQTITQEWAEYTWTFTAQDPPSGSNRLVLDLGRSAEVFFIDNVVVSEVEAFMCP